jgi:RNA polymerase sigma factor (sigma-70 family)
MLSPDDMPAPDEPTGSLLTSITLLEKLRTPEDHASWRRFDQRYRNLLLRFARRAGLEESAAEDVAQEVLIDVVQAIPKFEYDRDRCKFKSWLLTIAQRRIVDHRRRQQYKFAGQSVPRETVLDTTLTQTLPAPDPVLEEAWREEWRRHLLDSALERVKTEVDPLQFQMFHLHVVHGQTVRQICERLGVRGTAVYWAKYHIGKRLKKAMHELESGEP